MEHVYSLNEAQPDGPTLLTIGSFDGVHQGHQKLVKALVTTGEKLGLQTVVCTFFPHPSVVLHGRQPQYYINNSQEKANLLADLGVDLVITHPFDDWVSKQTAEAFVRQLRTALDFRQLWCGKDFALGHGREGTVEWLRAHAKELGYDLRVFDSVTYGKQVISSSRILRALSSGNILEVNHCLGRHIRIPGTVIEGTGRGTKIGIPTANLAVWEERVHPATGVYACYAQHQRTSFQAVVNIGYRPTFHESQEALSIEAHILDHDADLYGEELHIDFVSRLRPEIKFDTIATLVTQIQEDIAKARTILSLAQSHELTFH